MIKFADLTSISDHISELDRIYADRELRRTPQAVTLTQLTPWTAAGFPTYLLSNDMSIDAATAIYDNWAAQDVRETVS